MAKKPTDIARQLSNNPGVAGSQSVTDIAKKLNEGVGKPMDVSKTKMPLEGSGRKGKK